MSDNKSNIALLAEHQRNEPEWKGLCLRDTSRGIKPILRNVLFALREDPCLCNAFGFDEMARQRVVTAPLFGRNADDLPRPLTDTDVAYVLDYLQDAGMHSLTLSTTATAVETRATECAFHPVRDYLDALSWDGRERVATWTASYLGTPRDGAYEAAVGRFFLLSMVARIFRPGCQADYMVVLEGAQGVGKSSACAILAGDWFSDQLPKISSKDASLALRGKWLIEAAEMHTLNRAEVSELKAFLTRREEKFRPPYGRQTVVEPRQCVFIGTTNQQDYQRDETGGRRFWPLRTADIRLDALAMDRDQLFAEATHLYRRGMPWWPDRQFEAAHIVPEQASRQESDAWEGAVMEYVEGKGSLRIGDIARDALEIDIGKLGKAEQNRIKAILRRNGWQRAEKKDGHGYYPWSPVLRQMDIEDGR